MSGAVCQRQLSFQFSAVVSDVDQFPYRRDLETFVWRSIKRVTNRHLLTQLLTLTVISFLTIFPSLLVRIKNTVEISEFFYVGLGA